MLHNIATAFIVFYEHRQIPDNNTLNNKLSIQSSSIEMGNGAALKNTSKFLCILIESKLNIDYWAPMK